ncbi:TonB-dependent receptor domain-containing protein [Mucilaginibacter sp. McL0603]|uniref:TonB-dependent receptor domain-containing protein n=1 Tax=Mucilaginibacter sp. McL0603 TaxID=3415670 RepID=UPI003CFB49B0
MRNFFTLLFFLCSALVLNAQPYNNPKGRLTGKVIDASTKQPVDYATVSIFKDGGASPINGVVTDPKGVFVITNLNPGEYSISIDFIGYQKKIVDHLTIGAATPNIELGTISIAPIQNQLKSVEIVSKAPVVENKIDKMVYNVTNDLTSQGGSAADVLQKVPQVTVDIDGNVQLQGNSNIRFLINGKPSSIFGASLADALQSIPASQIKNIEVITSPGAKYDANGTGGIINIVLKDSKIEGVNGNVNLSAGTRRENANLNLNVREGNFGVNAFFGGGEQINSTTLNTNNSLSYSQTRDTTTKLLQKGTNSFTRGGFQSGISFNWDITKKDALTASFGYNYFANHNHGLTNQESTEFDIPNNNTISDIFSLRNSESRFSGRYLDYSLNYKKTFAKEGQELDVLFNSSYGNNKSYSFQKQNYLNGGYPTSGTQSDNPGTDHETDISIDYTQPVTKTFTIETGAKAVLENINNSVVTDTLLNGAFVPNANQTYGFNYNRKVYSYYLSTTFSLFNNFINGKAGLRDEYTSTSDNFPGANIPGYNTLAPSAVLSHKIDESQSFKLSYSYRIQRPDYGDLNPFYNISDPHNISVGNPNLKPEIGHNYEFGYNKSFNQGANIYIGAFYRYNTNDIQTLTTHYDAKDINGTTYSDVYLTQRYNIGTETTDGVSLFASLPVTKALNLRTNIMFGDRITTNPGFSTVSGYVSRINLNATYDFGNNLIGEVFGNYNSSQRTIQGTRPAFAFYNLAVRKQLWNKKASIGLTATDPFTKYINQTTTTSGANFTQTSLRQVPFRSFGITLSYKFGKLEFKKEKDKDDNNNDAPAPENSSGK